MNIIISKELDISIYKQIVNHITKAAMIGTLKPGEKLPTQREFSIDLNIARGTIQKAFEELENKGIIETIKGSGSFISKKREITMGDNKQVAIDLIEKLLDKLTGLSFTTNEIKALINRGMHERESQQYKVRIVAIECNPEALEIFKTQITFMENIEFKMFVLDEVLKYSKPEKVFEDYDIIITTLAHYDKVKEILYSLRNRLFKVAVSPAPDTIIRLVTIPKNIKLGIIIRSINFRNIMLRHLKSFNIENERVENVFDTDKQGISRLLKEKNILIIPQCFKLQEVVIPEELQQFEKNGGKIIEFKYQIERGSLIYIEEQIENIHRSKQE